MRKSTRIIETRGARRRVWRLAGLIACGLASGCRDATTVTDGALTVERQWRALALHNASAAPLYYFIVESTTATLIDWIPCAGPTCPGVGAHGVVRVPDSLIVGYAPAARSALVYWWRLALDGNGGLYADSLHSLVIQL